nr:FAD-dependent oxidoreductase [Candidatus Sigynarchaeota archaeon]
MMENVRDGKDSSKNKPRIGVFVCHCGSNIGGLIDCKMLAEYASTLPDVVHSEDNLYTCSENGLTNIRKAIKDYSLNRIVVASCTPRTHEALFRETVKEEGLNPYLFNFVNIRDQCTWVHMKQPEAAFKKAKDLIKMGAAKARHLEALSKNELKVNQVAIVIGGGVAGISAAISLSKQGFKVHLIEKKDSLGGNVNSFHSLFPGSSSSAELVKKLLDQVKGTQNLQVHLSSTVKDINGYVGNFGMTIEKDGKRSEINAGAIIVATGASVFKPIGMYNYDGRMVITQLELEQELREKRFSGKDIVMIQCVGARD